MTTTVTCPNCRGRDSSHWPFGPCTICGGTGQTRPETAAQVVANRKADARGEAPATQETYLDDLAAKKIRWANRSSGPKEEA